MVIKTKNVSSMYETEKYRFAGKLKPCGRVSLRLEVVVLARKKLH